MQDRLAMHLHVEQRGKSSAVEVTLESKGPQPHTRVPQSRVPVTGRGIPTKSGCKIIGDSNCPGEIEAC